MSSRKDSWRRKGADGKPAPGSSVRLLLLPALLMGYCGVNFVHYDIVVLKRDGPASSHPSASSEKAGFCGPGPCSSCSGGRLPISPDVATVLGATLHFAVNGRRCAVAARPRRAVVYGNDAAVAIRARHAAVNGHRTGGVVRNAAAVAPADLRLALVAHAHITTLRQGRSRHSHHRRHDYHHRKHRGYAPYPSSSVVALHAGSPCPGNMTLFGLRRIPKRVIFPGPFGLDPAPPRSLLGPTSADLPSSTEAISRPGRSLW